jgi:hypothetical protein
VESPPIALGIIPLLLGRGGTVEKRLIRKSMAALRLGDAKWYNWFGSAISDAFLMA